VWVADLVDTDAPTRVRWHWVLPGAVDVACAAGEGKRANGCATQVDLPGTVLAAWTEARITPFAIDVARAGQPLGWLAPGYGTLRPGLHVTAEVTGQGRMVTVTFIGPKLIPAAAAVRGHRVTCGATETSTMARLSGDEQETTSWLVQGEAGETIYVAGGIAQGSGLAGQPLHGVGHWTAYRWSPVLDTVA
jgi:hypothetical protein